MRWVYDEQFLNWILIRYYSDFHSEIPFKALIYSLKVNLTKISRLINK